MTRKNIQPAIGQGLLHLGKLILIYQIVLVVLGIAELNPKEGTFTNPLNYFLLAFFINISVLIEQTLTNASLLVILESLLIVTYTLCYFWLYKQSRYKKLWLILLGVATLGFKIRALSLILWFLFKDFSLLDGLDSL